MIMSSISPLLQQRVIQLEGTSNFRDIGGYQARDGLMVRWGQLYRSASLDTLSLADQNKLQELGIADSIDLRSGFERKKFAYAYPFLKTYACSIDSQIMDVAIVALKNHQQLTAAQASDFMRHIYSDFVLKQQDHFAHFFDLIIEQKQNTVFHCTAGKDRTGYACAMVHGALGVHRDDILSDYLLTQQCYRVSLTSMSQDFHLPEDVMQILWGVKAEYLDQALSLIDTEFGGMARYLPEQLKLDSLKQKQLFERFLDED